MEKKPIAIDFMKGQLTLIPTPIDEQNPLEQSAYELLLKAATQNLDKSIFVIEELKAGRRRWLRWKLPREVVEQFVLYNEHTKEEAVETLLGHLKAGKNVYLMSDGGLPAFCDPGQLLVDQCHLRGIKVTSTPFSNSVALAWALSGFGGDRFFFAAFPPTKGEQRETALKELIQRKEGVILMDTPYRLKRLLEEMERMALGREIFVALDLNQSNEELIRGKAGHILSQLQEFKREFVLVLSPQV